MPLSQLVDWPQTAKTLYQASAIIGPIRNALTEHVNNYLNLPMQVQPYGLSSGTLPQGGRIRVDYTTGALHYDRPNARETVTLPFSEHTQASLFEALLAAMQADELADFLADVEDDSLVAGLMKKIKADDSKSVFFSIEEVTHQQPLAYSSATASGYAQALDAIFTGVARFRARLNGHMTPVVVWPEHFDLSTLWFKEAEMLDSGPHINIGFAPYSNNHQRPYLYAYAYPYPAGYTPPQLPVAVQWETEDYTGPYLDYDVIAEQADPVAYVETVCDEIFAALLPLLD